MNQFIGNPLKINERVCSVDDALKLVDPKFCKGNPIISGEHLKDYLFPRKFHENINIQSAQINNLEKVIILNAFKFNEAVDVINARGHSMSDAIFYSPLMSLGENYIYTDNTIFIINPKEKIRMTRDISQVERLPLFLERDIKLEVINYGGTNDTASTRFKRFADYNVNRAFDSLDKNLFFNHGKLYVIFGPHDALPDFNKKNYLENKDEFLPFKILTIGDKQIIHFDFVFGLQAMNTMGGIFTHLDSIFYDLKDRRKLDLSVMHYGKIGVLNSGYNVGSVCVPCNGLYEDDIMHDHKVLYPINNQLVYNPKISEIFKADVSNFNSGTTVNTWSVLDQTHEQLNKFLSFSGDFVEMEWMLMYLSKDNPYVKGFRNLGLVDYYFAGVASDNPRHGQNLGNTKYTKEGEMKIYNSFIEIIKEM